MANMEQGQIKQTISGDAMDNLPEGDLRRACTAIRKAASVSRHRRTPTKTKISLSFSELSMITFALGHTYGTKGNDDYTKLYIKLAKKCDEQLEKEIAEGLIFWRP